MATGDSKKYAQALYEVCVEKTSPKDLDKYIAGFIELLSLENKLGLLNEIMEKFSAMCDNSGAVVNATIISPKKISEMQAGKIKEFIKKHVVCKDIVFEEKRDGKLLGGFVLKFRDMVLDLSTKGRISQLRDYIKK
ncbi:MAG: F0F1 ATP synthase subunit delta [Candidatus Paceibacterota bacterium]|jgi:ATP synthase F1 delta subunit